MAYGVVGVVSTYSHFQRTGRLGATPDEIADVVGRFVVRSLAADDEIARRSERPSAPDFRCRHAAVACRPRHRPNDTNKGASTVAHEFLSDDWIEAAKAIRDKHAAEVPKIASSIKMNQVITDAPGGGEIKMFMDTSSGELVIDKGELPDAEVTITLPYDVAKKQMVDQDAAAAMQAFMSGKVKVQGDMMKLMSLQGMGTDEASKKINDEIKEMTA